MKELRQNYLLCRLFHSCSRLLARNIPGLPRLNTKPKPIDLSLLQIVQQKKIQPVQQPATKKKIDLSWMRPKNVEKRHMAEIRQKILPTNWKDQKTTERKFFFNASTKTMP
jgi:hypothetical protein